jgi:hypothetical protein
MVIIHLHSSSDATSLYVTVASSTLCLHFTTGSARISTLWHRWCNISSILFWSSAFHEALISRLKRYWFFRIREDSRIFDDSRCRLQRRLKKKLLEYSENNIVVQLKVEPAVPITP